jgi:hypothetical protein
VIRISKFWIDFAAGRHKLSRAWAKKDAEIALRDSALLDELSEAAWMHIDGREQRRLLRDAVPVEA